MPTMTKGEAMMDFMAPPHERQQSELANLPYLIFIAE